jgi:hypothetical protein
MTVFIVGLEAGALAAYYSLANALDGTKRQRIGVLAQQAWHRNVRV